MTYFIEYLANVFGASDFNGPFAVFWFLFTRGGWVIVALFFLWGLWQIFRSTQNGRYAATLNYILLAIDVPVENEQTLKAVEQIFAQIAGVHATLSFKEKYWTNKSQDAFSFEIVSLGGHVQFLIRCLDRHRDLVESTVYAQYPNAEVTEVEDYVNDVPEPKDWPSDDWDLWGTEIILAKDEYFPIRTYFDFEHQMTQIFADPLAAILEIIGRIRPGEQMWLQFVINHPDKPNWDTSKAEEFITKQLGKTVKQKSSNFGKMLEAPFKALDYIAEEAIGTTLGLNPEVEEKKEEKFSVGAFSLSPGELDALKAIQRKVSKLAFHTKARMVYVGKKEVFNKSRVGATFGAFKQFNTQDLNAFKPYTKSMTSALYFNVKKRVIEKQRAILQAYKRRSTYAGSGVGKIMNIEELASVWHFPLTTVTGPMIKKSEAKKAGPPANLGFEDELTPETQAEIRQAKSVTRPTVPPKITSVTESIINKNFKLPKKDFKIPTEDVSSQETVTSSKDINNNLKKEKKHFQKTASVREQIVSSSQVKNKAKPKITDRPPTASSKGGPPVNLPI